MTRKSAAAIGLSLIGLLAAPPPASGMSQQTALAMPEGLELLYNLDYEASREHIQKLIAAEPENPYGYLFEAGALWWQSSNEYGLFKDTPTLEDLFERDVEQAIDKSKEWLDTDDDLLKAEGHYTLGMTLGIRGQWALLRGKYFRAYSDGRKAVKHLNKAVKLDPTLYDAYLGLGLYDYQCARLPGILKVSVLIGVRGDMRRGLERMALASEKGRYSADQAAQMLSTVYIAELKDYPKGLELIRRLRKSFPRSGYFQFLEATTLARAGDFKGSLAAMKRLFARIPADKDLADRKQMSLLCGLTGEKCLEEEELRSAVDWLTKALEAERAPSPWATALRTYRGICLDMLGRRQEAVEDYVRSLGGPPAFGLEAWSKTCLMHNCSRGQVMQIIKQMSLQRAP